METVVVNNNAIKVAIRLRNDNEQSNYIRTNGSDIILTKNDSSMHNYTYDHVFEAETNQAQVYNQGVASLLDKYMNEFNVTIFAYGQTGSGKTYTIGSNKNDTLINDPKEGIIPRSLKHLFESINMENFELSISLLEIDQSKLVDLFNIENKKLSIQNYSVKDLKKIIIKDLSSSMDIIKKGISLRKVDKTNMNKESSRSHLVFTVYLNNKNTDCITKLNIIDLAGTEKAGAYYKKSSNKNLLVQGSSINNSLMQLKLLIHNLSKGITNISYSANNLTKILKDALGGNSYTLLIACINTKASCFTDTCETLDFSNMVKSIKNKPLSSTSNSSTLNKGKIDQKLLDELNLLRELKCEYEKLIKKNQVTIERASSPIRIDNSEIKIISETQAKADNQLYPLKDKYYKSIGLKDLKENDYFLFKYKLLDKCFSILNNSQQFTSCHQLRINKKSINVLIRCNKFYKEKCETKVNFNYFEKTDCLVVEKVGYCSHYENIIDDIPLQNNKKSRHV